MKKKSIQIALIAAPLFAGNIYAGGMNPDFQKHTYPDQTLTNVEEEVKPTGVAQITTVTAAQANLIPAGNTGSRFTDTVFQKYKQPVPESKLSFEMVPVPAGNFSMTDEKRTTKNLKISAFWMSAHEVTFDAFDIF